MEEEYLLEEVDDDFDDGRETAAFTAAAIVEREWIGEGK